MINLCGNWVRPVICLCCQFPVFLSNSLDLAYWPSCPEEHFPFPHSALGRQGGRAGDEREAGVWLNLTHCSGQWAAYRVYPNIGACFAKAVERRSTLLNQCCTQSCAHARLLCVKPQEAELAHNQQPAPLLRTPLTMKEKRAVLHTRPKNFFNTTSCSAAFWKSVQQFSSNCHGALKRNSIFI